MSLAYILKQTFTAIAYDNSLLNECYIPKNEKSDEVCPLSNTETFELHFCCAILRSCGLFDLPPPQHDGSESTKYWDPGSRRRFSDVKKV